MARRVKNRRISMPVIKKSRSVIDRLTMTGNLKICSATGGEEQDSLVATSGERSPGFA